MYYLVQENVFRDQHYHLVLNALNRLGLEHEIVSLNKSESFEFNTDRKDVFCFGSIKLARLAKQNAWTPGSLMNENHDYGIYSEYWKENMLNWDGHLQTLSKPVGFKQNHQFIRPAKDSKIFNGGVYTKEEWTAISSKLLTRKDLKNEMIQIANPKKIYQEIRCWVINKKVVSASTYKIGKEVRYQEYKDIDGLSFANEMVQQYQPAQAFVLDICLTEKGWKIVEINCMNSAGFYACNLQKLIMELEKFYT